MPQDALRAAFLQGMSRAAATVSVVTTDGPAGRAGVTVSAMTSVSADGPAPTMLVCINQGSSAAAPIIGNKCFMINVLGAEHRDIADVFASRYPPPGGDKFNATGHAPLTTGAPALDAAIVAFDCDVISSELIDTHHVLIGAVRDVRVSDTGTPLLYGMRSYLKPERA